MLDKIAAKRKYLAGLKEYANKGMAASLKEKYAPKAEMLEGSPEEEMMESPEDEAAEGDLPMPASKHTEMIVAMPSKKGMHVGGTEGGGVDDETIAALETALAALKAAKAKG